MIRDWKMCKSSNERYLVYNDNLQKSKSVNTQEEAKELRNRLNKIINLRAELKVELATLSYQDLNLGAGEQ